ncbi:helix-turn-helix domain-containing protein [Streptomyces paradoxus]|uniref:Sugar-specific transcriptional regulator TrmB/DNA-binding CsgD family transcriptional regulator n=1 Tax=Streptomyces paradoxus TaxID=66375 RepID=A0A7W9TJQ5_9ACTN|nr:helix-turn-helix domain-containing protein [Streptomyces paradoxus]MBB6081656.1 sugar-specific transcriptional regulator TrmB/DNA-binding CsgD family transcriptional regulator [Streptomyces paradoxus]
MLEVLGLDARASRVYEVMVSQPEWTVADIAAHLAVAPDEVRDALDTLARKSLLRPAEGHPERLRAINPAIGLSALLAGQEAELAEQRAQIARTRQEAARLASRWTATHVPHGSVELLEDEVELRRRQEELTARVRLEVLSFLPGGAQSADVLAVEREAAEGCLARGVRIREAFTTSAMNDAATSAHTDWMARAGAEVRLAPALPTRLVVWDSHTALVPAEPGPGLRAGLLLTAPGIVTALVALFEAVWAGAEPVHEEAPHDRSADPQDLQLVRFLRSGLTDEAMSRQLGVSVRTTRRMLAGLYARLGARCRFEAGYEAARRGWL